MCIVGCVLRYSVISCVMYAALSMYLRRFIHTVYLNEHISSTFIFVYRGGAGDTRVKHVGQDIYEIQATERPLEGALTMISSCGVNRVFRIFPGISFRNNKVLILF